MKQKYYRDLMTAVVLVLSLVASAASFAGAVVLPEEQQFMDECITIVHDLYQEEYGAELIQEPAATKVLVFSHVLRGCVFMWLNRNLDFNQYLWAACTLHKECVPPLSDPVEVFVDKYYCEECDPADSESVTLGPPPEVYEDPKYRL